MMVNNGLFIRNGITAANQDVQIAAHFLAGKTIKTARSVVMKLSKKSTYREIYDILSLVKKRLFFHISTRYLYLSRARNNHY